MPHPTPDVPARPRQTGPKTPAGKAKSKMNAARHGLRAANAVLPGEDPAAYDQFLAEVAAAVAPVGALEEELAAQVAAALWRLRRTDRWDMPGGMIRVIVAVEELERAASQVLPSPPGTPPLFAGRSDDYLLSLGLPPSTFRSSES